MQPIVRTDPLVIVQGCTFEKSWQWFAGGRPVDLSGTEFELVAKAEAGAAEVLLYLITGAGITVSGNTITVRIEATTTSGYSWRSAVFDLRVTWPGPEPRRVDPVITGKMIVKPGVLP